MYLAEAKITALNYSKNDIVQYKDTLKAKDCKTCNYDQIFDKCDASCRSTNIICTIGPSSDNIETIVKMLDAGMNIARLNFSHGNHEQQLEKLMLIKEALLQRPEKQCAILLDTKGPEIRTGFIDDYFGKVQLKAGQELDILTDYSALGTNEAITCSYKSLPTTVSEGSTIYIGDGNLTCKVLSTSEDRVTVRVQNDYVLGEKKNMNLPGAIIDLPTLTE